MARKNALIEESDLFVGGNRPKWSTEQQIRLWVKCGGRCTLCNNYLLDHPFFGDPGKFGQLAHIIAHANGTRPNMGDYTREYIESIDNIMVLCPECHLLIDKKSNEQKYDEIWLRQKKAEHEAKIKDQTQPTMNSARTAIRFCATIGGQTPTITNKQIREALFPDYFVGADKILDVKIDTCDLERNPYYWRNAVKELKAQFMCRVSPCLKVGEKFAVFGIAPIPLLVQFGHLLSDLNVTNVQNRFRDTDNPWAWPSLEDADECGDFHINRPDSESMKDGCRKVLILSLTAPIRNRIKQQGCAIWEVSPVEGPHYESINSKQRLDKFGKLILELIEEISKVPGDKIHVYSAIPNSAAIMLGMKIMKKSNQSLILYDFISSKNKDVKALELKAL